MTNIKKIILILFIGLIFNNILSFNDTFAQTNTLVNWMSLEEAVEKHQENPKTILIDMYTDWCGWCKRMDETTFSNPSVAQYINTNFYPVKFNAERTDTVEYLGQTYVNTGEGRRPSHQLAQALMGGRMSYPTIVYIDDEMRVNPVPGYMDPERIQSILVYFAERINKVCDFADFEKDYNNTFDINFNKDNDGEVNWMDFDNAVAKMETEPKRMILFFHSEYVNGSKLMRHSVFRHPVLANYLNEEFYAVRVNYDTKDTLHILNNTFINEGEQLGYPHQLTIALLQPEIRLPAMVFFDSDFTLIYALRGYFPPKIVERYFSFISKGLYKDGNWEEFNQDFESEIEE